MSSEQEQKDKKSRDSVKKSSAESKAQGKSKKGVHSNTSFDLQMERPRGPLKVPRLKMTYQEKLVENLKKQLSLKNKMEIPRLEKIIVSACVKEALSNPKVLEGVAEEIALITGQKPKITRAKKSIAGFKLRGGQAIGAVVTLRRASMYEFFDRLVNVALPRVRDFKGVSPKSFDGRGNYSLGIKEQIIFPEINYDRIEKVRGLNITIATTARTNEHARALLSELGMPFRK